MTKQITIYDLIPFMRRGWVAYSPNGHWTWCNKKPELFGKFWISSPFSFWEELPPYVFNIAPFEGNPEDSLIKIDNKEIENDKDTN